MRDISLNCHYLIIKRLPRDLSQLNIISRQLRPDAPKKFIQAYNDSTLISPYGYLIVDLHVDTPNDLRLRGHGILEKLPMVFYK